jgi:hypothetical protein
MEKKEKLVKELINKMLEKHAVNYDDIKENQKIGDIEWFMYYTWTQEEYEIFKKWAIPLIKKTLRITKEGAEKEFSWFDLMWGLKVV